jgi:IstB-like ATP binding protein
MIMLVHFAPDADLVGKTMLSAALARAGAGAGAGDRVYSTTTAADLAAECHKAAIEGRWNTCMRFFAGPRLLVIDGLSAHCPSRSALPRFHAKYQHIFAFLLPARPCPGQRGHGNV